LVLVAAATGSASAFGGAEDFFFGGNATFFEGFGDEAIDFIGDALEGLLSLIELADERVVFGLIAELGEGVNFGLGDFLSGVLFVVEFLLGLGEAAVEADG